MNDSEIKIFNQNNLPDYKSLLHKYDLDLDIFYQPEFLKLEARNLGGEYEIFTLTQPRKNQIFIYPYIKLAFEGELSDYIDLASPYGYAGPYCNENSLFSHGENEFIKYAKTQNIITEFIRYHFLYNDELKFSEMIENELNRTLVVIDLSKKWDDIWMKEISMNNRNYVRKLEKEGYLFEINISPSIIEEFIDMYYRTMQQAHADKCYYFKKGYFHQLFEELKGKIQLARITKHNVTYSTVIFFVSGKILHLYLMGRNLDYPKVPATNLLYTKVAKWAKEQGILHFNIGGGRTNSEEDSLFRFKKNFTKQTHPFYIGKRIYQKTIYQQLIKKFIDKHGQEKYQQVKNILQFYRI